MVMRFQYGTLRSPIMTFAGAVSCALVAAVCLVTAWWVVFQARIGPVLASLTDSHGVHAGDAAGVAYTVVGFGLIVWAASLWEDGVRKLRRVSAGRRYATTA